MVFCYSLTCVILLFACGVKYGHSLGSITEILSSLGSNFLNNFVDKVTESLKKIAEGGIQIPGVTEKCCGKYGCFTINPPFGLTICRPIAFLPQCQDKLKIKFYLWTRENPKIQDVIDPDNLDTLKNNSHFRNTGCVFIVIHGYFEYGDELTIKLMRDALLKKKDCMFISVDWKLGASMDYISSIANAQMVSAVTAHLVLAIKNSFDVPLSDFHIAGLSLGAHAAGGVGKRVPGIGRITGVEPAGPLFHNCDATSRLSRTDAEFVDVMHLDIDVFGTETPSGHVDIYVSGGKHQPACLGLPGCSHILSSFYFIDSIEADCPYYAYQCDDQDNFMRGKCSKGCGPDGSLCVPMGYRADEWKNHTRESPTLFFMAVAPTISFCVYHYYMEINCTDDKIMLWQYGRNKDQLYINLIGATGETGLQRANQNSIRYITLPSITSLITARIQIGQITRVVLKWEPSVAIVVPPNCQNKNATSKPTAVCCVETFDAVSGRCSMCPYVIKSIFARNLETSNSARFDGGNKTLVPNAEVSFNAAQNV